MTKTNGAGYTIIELMIVLAVTAVTAMSALTMIRGQQGKNEFSVGVRDFENKLTDIANDVAKGYFPDKGGYRRCTSSSTSIDFAPAGSVAIDQQGSSSGCIFAGKAIQFQTGGNAAEFKVVTLAARRRGRDNKNVSSLADLGTKNDIRGVPDSEELFKITNSLRVEWVRVSGGSVSSIAFLSGFGKQPSAGDNLTGAPETDLYWLRNTSFGQSDVDFQDQLTTRDNYQTPDTSGIQICLDQGGGNRAARITLGRDGRALTTTSQIETNRPC